MANVFFGGGISTKVGTYSYNDTFQYEWTSYFLIWAAPTNKTGQGTQIVQALENPLQQHTFSA
jgi:hypothetical protein